MFIASGDVVRLVLGEAIAVSEVHVVATMVTSGQEVLMFTGLSSGATVVDLISGNQAFIDQLTISNEDTVEHFVDIIKFDGSINREILSVLVRPQMGLQFRPSTGWVRPVSQVPTLSSGAVASGHIANVNIGNAHLSSGAVMSSNIASGQVGGAALGSDSVNEEDVSSGIVTPNKLGSGAVLSHHIASGQVGGLHFGSGALVSGHIGSGQVDNVHLGSGISYISLSDPVTTEELISGYKPINISQSGYARVAMAGVSGRMPVYAVCLVNIASGVVMSPLSGNAPMVVGGLIPTSGVLPTSVIYGQFLFCGMSGEIVQTVASGMVAQRLGKMIASGRMFTFIDQMITSGLNDTFAGSF